MRLERIIAGLAVSAVFIVIAGVSPWAVSLALLLPALLASVESSSTASSGAVAVAAAAGLSGGGPQGEALVIISCMIGLVFCRRAAGRLAIALPLVVLIAWGNLPGIVPLSAGAAAAIVPGRRKWRFALLTAGTGAGLIFIGLPGTVDHGTRTARSIAAGGGALWPDTVSLFHSSPGLQLDLSTVTGMEIRAGLSAGGLRSDEPAGYLLLGPDTVRTIMSGDTVITFTASTASATIVQVPDWKPFNHPVLRFYGAATGQGTR